jgi:hypothetical protein
MATKDNCNCQNALDGNLKDSNRDKYQLPCVVKKGSAQSSYDIIWDVIPFYELLDYAKAHYDICSFKSDNEISACAEQVVKSVICPCCAEQGEIINAIVEEFINQLKNSKEEGR